MWQFFLKFREITSPVSQYWKRIFCHIVFRLSFLVIGLFVANKTGQIVTLLSEWADFSSILVPGIEVFASIGFSIVILVITVWGKLSWPHLESRMLYEVRKRVFSEYLGKEISVSEATGKTIALFENGIASWIRLVDQVVLEFPINTSAFIAVFSYLIVTQLQLLPIICIYVLGITFLMLSFQKKIEPLRKARSALFESRTRMFVRSIMERRTVFMYGAVDQEIQNLSHIDTNIMEVTDDLARIRVPLYRIPQHFLEIIRMTVVLTLAYLSLQGSAKIGDVVAASVAFGFLDKYFQALIDSFQIYSDEQTNFLRLREYLDTMPRFHRLWTGETFIPKKGEILFKNVSFSYWDEKDTVIENLSLAFHWGKKTALVGRSGAGKTTIMKLLLGMIQPRTGTILVDGQDLSTLRLDSYFPHIWYLPQEPSVFDGTIRENLCYGLSRSVSDDEAWAALDHARCEFVRSMKEGLLTEIGERGIRLSWGERQRLAIARIFLRNPEILVLDEPTSALDSFSESAVTAALHELFEGKTVIIVAHRLQTVKESDTIIVMGGGEVIESGNHLELLAQGGEYAEMVELQDGRHREATIL